MDENPEERTREAPEDRLVRELDRRAQRLIDAALAPVLGRLEALERRVAAMEDREPPAEDDAGTA